MTAPIITASRIRARMPRWWPGPVRRLLARCALRALALDRINDLYLRCCPSAAETSDTEASAAETSPKRHRADRSGGYFALAVLDDLHIRIHVHIDPDTLLTLGRYRTRCQPFVIVANHPFGALDGVALIATFSPLCPNLKLIANNILWHIAALRPTMLTVDPLHAAGHKLSPHNLTALHSAYRHIAGGGPLALFPTGHVMTLGEVLRPGRAAQWPAQVHKMLRHLDVPILPVHIAGRNTLTFYLLGLLGWRLRTLRLPREVFRKRGATIHLHIGPFMSPEDITLPPTTSPRCGHLHRQ